MFATLLQVAAGGAIGASARYLTGIGVARIAGPGFPLGVMTANVAGCLLMGIFVGLAAQKGLGWMTPFVATGLLGGFTTFSAFSLEAIELMERGEAGQAAAYVLLSVGASLGALYAGLVVVRSLTA